MVGRRFLEHSVSDVIALCRSKDLPFELRGGSGKLAQSLLPLEDLGLGYLHLGQPLSTLSTGEAQRLRLCRTLSGLPRSAQNYLVIVDEPSAGLSASDLDFVIKAFMAYTDRHATVICVDHDPLLIASADHVIELGPGGGPEGGAIVLRKSARIDRSEPKTGRALADAKGRVVQARATSKQVQSSAIEVHKAREHNLKNVSVRIPHGKLVVVTGPSGSGKSTLAFDVIFAEGQRRFWRHFRPMHANFCQRCLAPMSTPCCLFRLRSRFHSTRFVGADVHSRHGHRSRTLSSTSLCQNWNPLLPKMPGADRVVFARFVVGDD